MEPQLSLAMMNDELGQARTSKKDFLNKIENIIPWTDSLKKIEPCYYKGERGNKPYPLELMLRIFLLQNLYYLADMRVMTEVIDSLAFSEFCGVTSSEFVRCKVEHIFAVVKQLFGYRKTRYRGLRKQTAKLNIMFALANLYLADKFSVEA